MSQAVRPLKGAITASELWPMLELPFYGKVALGNVTQITIGMFWVKENEKLFIGIELHGAYTFSGLVHEGYVQEKLRFKNGDSGNIADFINAQLGISAQIQGQYEDDLYDRGE